MSFGFEACVLSPKMKEDEGFVTASPLESQNLTVLGIQVSGTSTESSTTSPEHHAIVLPPSTGGGKRVHPIPYLEGSVPGM